MKVFGLFAAGTFFGVILYSAAGDAATGIAAMLALSLVGLVMGLALNSAGKPCLPKPLKPCDCDLCGERYDVEPPLTKDECAAMRAEIESLAAPKLRRVK